MNNNVLKELEPLILYGLQIETVGSLKYLGTFIDSKLIFADNVEYVLKKARQRLHLISRLQHFGVSQHILEMVYKNLVESVVCFNMTMWYGLLPVKEKQKLGRVF